MIRGWKGCLNCKTHGATHEAFCGFCGNERVRVLACPSCNFINDWQANFCGGCGVSLCEDRVQSPNHNYLGATTAVDRAPTTLDHSVIDVTNAAYAIPGAQTPTSLTKCSFGVPHWEHEYIYEYSEIEYASKKQREFYEYFKAAFLNGVPLDIEGNTNYAFILLFDLRNQHRRDGDTTKLEESFSRLGMICPKTIKYALGILREIMGGSGDNEGLGRLRSQQQAQEYWRFGSSFKDKLKLTTEEVALLNKLSYPRSSFTAIGFCCIAVIKLYLSAIAELRARYLVLNTTLEAEFERLADVVARKHFRYRTNSQGHRWKLPSINDNLYLIVHKHCENAVRDLYGHKRKLNTVIFDSPDARAEIADSIESKFYEILPAALRIIKPPDENAEIELNALNANRWKAKFDQLTATPPIDGKEFVANVIELGRLNRRNPAVEKVFYEASKFISKVDRVAALNLYVYYLHYDLLSIKFDNKKLTKTIQKTLFKTNEQLHQFEAIVSEFISDRNLDKALGKLPEIYATKRKSIRLDSKSIQEVHTQHSGTVGLLNEYLQDEFEDAENLIVSREINREEVQITITRKGAPSVEASNVELSSLQIELLILFAKNNFYVDQAKIEGFARLNGSFGNQLVESINDACLEILDDVLIEEEEEQYSMDPEYYRRIRNS